MAEAERVGDGYMGIYIVYLYRISIPIPSFTYMCVSFIYVLYVYIHIYAYVRYLDHDYPFPPAPDQGHISSVPLVLAIYSTKEVPRNVGRHIPHYLSRFA